MDHRILFAKVWRCSMSDIERMLAHGFAFAGF